MQCLMVIKEDGKQAIIKCANEDEASQVREIYSGNVLAEGDSLQDCIQNFQQRLDERSRASKS